MKWFFEILADRCRSPEDVKEPVVSTPTVDPVYRESANVGKFGALLKLNKLSWVCVVFSVCKSLPCTQVPLQKKEVI